MTEKQAHGMLLFHQRNSRAFRQVANDPKTKKVDRERLLRDAHSADMMAAECQAILQMSRGLEESTES